MAVNVIAVMLGFTVSAWLTSRFCDPASRFHILDHPNERSLHTQPTPRSGGLAILAGVVLGFALTAWHFGQVGNLLWLLLSVLSVATVSYIDDRYHVPVIGRLSAHLMAAGLLLWAGFSLRMVDVAGHEFSLSSAAGGILSVIFIVWMINLYNFMDGMDGFAGGMAVIGFGAFALLGWQAGNSLFMLLNLITAAAAAGFLIFNFPPARIFMGDVGSSTLGLLAAASALWGARDGIFPFWIAVLIFSPFVIDASVTLIRRAFRGEKIWQAHKSHYYQKLVQAGWGHRKTVLLEYAIMLGCEATALWGVHASNELRVAILAGWALFYSVFFFWVTRLAIRRSKAGIL
jgi:UDP-N-acetylmuramyl pentapeptide phosphotransferase/UDP-N-acetylglucosamine-1-phosphate transferase